MATPPERPIDEAERLETLAGLRILDTPSDDVLTGLARTAATVAGCPIALVSLVDRDRQWFKAHVGLERVETPRNASFCAHTILGDRILEVPDAAADPRFADSPLVIDEPHARFYAGVPLAIDGRMIGTLCVFDRVPRRLDDAQRGALVDLGRAVEQWMRSWRQQVALGDAEAYRRSLFERLGDGVMLFDQEYRILDANPFVTALLGYDRQALLGLGGQDIVADFERHRLATDHSADRRDSRRLAEWEFVHRDGHPVPVEVNVRRLDANRYLAVVRDISRRRSREQLLLQLSQAVEQSVESVVVTRLDRTIEYVNKAATILFGYAREELIGRSMRLLQSGETPQATYDALAARIAAGQSWSGVLSSRRKDGSVYLQSTVVSPVRAAGGSVTHTIASMEDVTEKLRSGEELDRYRYRLEELVDERTAELAVAMQAAEAGSKAKSDFLLTMSHEIRTPMNGVIGIVDVLRQSSLTPYQTDLADTIRESAFALLRVIDDILDFSKIEAGRLALESESTCLAALVEGVCDSLQPVASSRNVRLQVFVDPLLPEYILTDGMRLRQILNNLVGNAIKFSGGRERPGRVRVSVEPDVSGAMRLTVADNGIGMTAEVRARIFQPFVQAESATTRRFGGTGLGLSICRRLAMLFSGSIEATSVPGQGSCFTVQLPLHVDRSRVAPEAQVIAGLHCHAVLTDRARAEDWCSYLRAAGAEATRWTSVQALENGIVVGAGAPTVVLVDEELRPDLSDWIATADGGGPLATVSVGRGQRRLARLIGPADVSLDGDALHRDVLLHAVALAIGWAEPGIDELPAATLTMEVPSVAEATEQGRLILVAEDNEINRKVIERQLALLGLVADVVPDGIAALDGWRTGRYGLLLTDLHMPGLDGYELTKAIRSEEVAGRRIPIVALTANALSGEADRCLAAGMDAYLTKPVQLVQLAAALDRWVPVRSGGVDHSSRGGKDAAASIFDGAVLRRLIGDDDALIAQLREGFLSALHTAAEEVRAAVAATDWKRVGDVAHRLKSSARAVGALVLGDSCERLEAAGATCDGQAVLDRLTDFETSVASVVAALPVGAADVSSPRGMSTPSTGVVIVDDDPFHLEVLEEQLAVLGVATVGTCRSGPEAVEWLRGRDTSALLVLLDLNMPGMDGVEFMRHLVDLRYVGAVALISGADVRVLETASKLATAYQLTVLGHLHKPVATRDLRLLLDHWSRAGPAQAHRDAKAYPPHELLRALHSAQLLLHFQPKVSLASGALVGVEALVRWNHPLDGLLHPASFVPVAESHGLIDRLTQEVLTLALAQARRWHDAGLALRVAVNVSMDNLTRVDFVESLLAEVARHGLQPSDLILEITESRLMRDARVPMDILTRLRLKQIGLSIDDFGTGHSSLSQLRDIPFDELKIDRSFVHGGGDHPTERAIFTASLEMAHQLGMTAVAEGIEDRADWDFAAAAGCDVAQGYFIARPMPGGDLMKWAAEWQRSFATS